MISSASPVWSTSRTHAADQPSRVQYPHHPKSSSVVVSLPQLTASGSSASSSSGPTSGSGSGSGPHSRSASSRLPAQLPPHVRHGLTPQSYHPSHNYYHTNSNNNTHNPIPQQTAPSPPKSIDITGIALPPQPHQDPAYQLPLMCRRIPKTPLYIPAALRPPERPIRHSPSGSTATFSTTVGSPTTVVYNPSPENFAPSISSRSSIPPPTVNIVDVPPTNSAFDFNPPTPVSFLRSFLPAFGGSTNAQTLGNTTTAPTRTTAISPPTTTTSSSSSSSSSSPSRSRLPSIARSYSRSSAPSRRASIVAVMIPEVVATAIAARLQPNMPGRDQAWPPVEGLPGRKHWKSDNAALVCDAPRCETEFGIFTRRHHCRSCGLVFCSAHSRYGVQLDQSSRFHPLGGWFRACGSCWRDFCVWDRLEAERSESGDVTIQYNTTNDTTTASTAAHTANATTAAANAAAASIRKHVINGSFHLPSTSTSTSACSSTSVSALGSSHRPSVHNSSATSVDSVSESSRSIHKARPSIATTSETPRSRDSVSSSSSATVQIHSSAPRNPHKQDAHALYQDSTHGAGSLAVSIPVSIDDDGNVFANEGSRNDRNRQSVFNPLGVSVPDQWNWSTF